MTSTVCTLELNLIRSVFPKWTEESVANFGNIIIGLGPHVGDVLGFYLDKWARESRIVTAELRRSLLGLVKLIGFVPEVATEASSTETFTLATALAGTLTLAAGPPRATISRHGRPTRSPPSDVRER